MSWKKNVRNVPEGILRKVAGFTNPNLVAGVAKRFSGEQLRAGLLSHLGISLTEAGLKYTDAIMPPAEQGRHSFWNKFGREIVRRDLPKETHYNYVDTPNWGDSSYGTHTVGLPYEKYPRDYIAPRHSTIEIECPDPSPGRSYYMIKFQVSEVLNRDDANFRERLIDCLNLLQENVGSCDVAAAGATMQDYVQTLHVAWDILPPGTVEEAIDRIFAGRQPSREEGDTVRERYKFFLALNPRNFVLWSKWVTEIFRGSNSKRLGGIRECKVWKRGVYNV